MYKMVFPQRFVCTNVCGLAFICLAMVAAAYDSRIGWPNDFSLKK